MILMFSFNLWEEVKKICVLSLFCIFLKNSSALFVFFGTNPWKLKETGEIPDNCIAGITDEEPGIEVT